MTAQDERVGPHPEGVGDPVRHVLGQPGLDLGVARATVHALGVDPARELDLGRDDQRRLHLPGSHLLGHHPTEVHQGDPQGRVPGVAVERLDHGVALACSAPVPVRRRQLHDDGAGQPACRTPDRVGDHARAAHPGRQRRQPGGRTGRRPRHSVARRPGRRAAPGHGGHRRGPAEGAAQVRPVREEQERGVELRGRGQEDQQVDQQEHPDPRRHLAGTVPGQRGPHHHEGDEGDDRQRRHQEQEARTGQGHGCRPPGGPSSLPGARTVPEPGVDRPLHGSSGPPRRGPPRAGPAAGVTLKG